MLQYTISIMTELIEEHSLFFRSVKKISFPVLMLMKSRSNVAETKENRSQCDSLTVEMS